MRKKSGPSSSRVLLYSNNQIRQIAFRRNVVSLFSGSGRGETPGTVRGWAHNLQPCKVRVKRIGSKSEGQFIWREYSLSLVSSCQIWSSRRPLHNDGAQLPCLCATCQACDLNGRMARPSIAVRLMGHFLMIHSPLQHTRFAAIHGNVNICIDSQFGAVIQAITIRKYKYYD